MFDHFLSILFPERCSGCGKGGTAFCPACLAAIRPARPLLEDFKGLALFDYSEKLVQKAVWELKYHRKSAAAKALTLHGAALIGRYLHTAVQQAETIIIVPVPQHYRRTLSRGFNQSALIAGWLLHILPGAHVQSLLCKTKNTAPQARAHDRQERMANLDHSMKIKKGVTLDSNTLYVIVDDVITTGSTMREAGRALCAAGAKNIYAIALAHGYARRI